MESEKDKVICLEDEGEDIETDEEDIENEEDEDIEEDQDIELSP